MTHDRKRFGQRRRSRHAQHPAILAHTQALQFQSIDGAAPATALGGRRRFLFGAGAVAAAGTIGSLAPVQQAEARSGRGALAIPAQVDVSLQWHATGRQVAVGAGASAEPTAKEAFEGSFVPATCVGRAAGRELGFSFATDTLTAEQFFAELGTERNGTFLQ